MRYTMMAFIDSYEEITFLVQHKSRFKAKIFKLYEEDVFLEDLTILYHANEHNMIKIGLRFTHRLDLHRNYYIVDDLKHHVPVYSGSIVRTTEFEYEYFYDGPLGFSYTKEETTFRVWSPVAKSIYISICYQDGSLDRRDLTYTNHGVWMVKIPGDLDGVSYAYYVKMFDYYEKVLDPYGIASMANREANYVIDVNKLYHPKHNKPSFSGQAVDAVIYEAHIHDLTCGLPNDKKGSYLGLIDNDANRGLNYISSLGVTHLQLMPIFDFGAVDDLKRDLLYNWGYNPEQYFVPSGWLSKNPNDPYSRLNELLELIDACHGRGLRVVMDVVFNHVYDRKNSPFEKLCPGYYFRVDGYGNYTNSSGCGNDLATEKRMFSRFILDNLMYWVKQFGISGFRFDLMGLLDIETLKYCYKRLKEQEPNLIVYGEGWNMPNTIPDAFRPHAYNHFKMPYYGFFNDKYRELLKGNQWNHSLGYAFGLEAQPKDIFFLLGGSLQDGYRFLSPNQSINYVECHDNYTMFDFATHCVGIKEEDAIDGCRLALEMICISLGVVFIHAGQEFYRTKQGVENSYKSDDFINLFDYDRKRQYEEAIEGIRELLKIRKEYKEFRMHNPYDIEQKMVFMEEFSNSHTVCYYLEGADYRLTIIVKNNKEPYTILLKNNTMIYGNHHKVLLQEENYVLKDMGVYLFKEVR